jgi:hypothetical protein
MTRWVSKLRSPLAISALVVVLFSGLACGDDDTDAGSVATEVGQAGGAQSELCQSLDELDSAVSDARDLNQDSSVNDAEEAADGVSSALDSVREAAGAVGAAAVTALQTAVEALSNAIDNLSGEDTIGQAAASLSDQIGSIADALEGLKSTGNCD